MEDYPLLSPAIAPSTPTPRPKKSRLTAGSLALIFLIVAWVSQAELSKALQHGSAGVKPYNKPFFITILNQSMMVVAFALNVFFLPKSDLCAPSKYLQANGLSVRRVAISGAFLAVIYCASTYFWFASIGENTVSVSIASGIYNSSVVWVFLLSLLFQIEVFSIPKAIGVVLAIAGVALSSSSSSASSAPAPSPAPSSTLLAPSPPPFVQIGYIEVLGSAMLYALFEVVLKLITNAAQHRQRAAHEATQCPPEIEQDDGEKNDAAQEEEVPIGVANIFTGTIGLAHMFVLSLLFVPFNALGVETFQWPSNNQWELLFLNAFMGTMFNVSFVAAIALMSPTLVSVSCLLTIPIAAATDLVLNNYRTADQHVTFTSINIAGLCLICLGFLAFVGLCQKAEGRGGKDSGMATV